MMTIGELHANVMNWNAYPLQDVCCHPMSKSKVLELMDTGDLFFSTQLSPVSDVIVVPAPPIHPCRDKLYVSGPNTYGSLIPHCD